ncbi:hypothetical protein M758_12G007000, partial [Ceratodon purpureus]
MSMHSRSRIADQRRGPGSYNPCLISTSAPAYSMGSRFKAKDNEMWQRGPGCYDLGEPKRGPSFSLGVRDSTKSNNQSSIPGPGAYNTTRSTFTKHSAPAYSMGGRSTSNSSTFQSPGPGAYNIDSSMNSRVSDAITGSGSAFGHSTMKSAPAFSFGGRSQSRMDSTPGPGSYNIDVGNSKKGGPAYSIACRENRFKGDKGSSPGPGAYNVSSIGRSAPSYTIAQKRQE